MKPGPRNLITDVAGLRVGNAQDDPLKSGTTVLVGDKPFVGAVHVMGGAPGTRETDLLAPDKLAGEVDAFVLSGGSAFGLDAASGVADGLLAMGRGFQVGEAIIPLVPAAILFDLTNGGDKKWDKNPYNALGRAALENAGQDFDLGSYGAGKGAVAGQLMGGLGSASLVLPSGYTVGALVAVNSFGAVANSDTGQFWAAPWEVHAEFGDRGVCQSFNPLADPFVSSKHDFSSKANTTIAIIATDAELTKAQAQRIATVAHDGMARAIIPSHTLVDGDLVFAAATGQHPLTDPIADQIMLGYAAAHCLSRAIARGVFSATVSTNDSYATWQQKYG